MKRIPIIVAGMLCILASCDYGDTNIDPTLPTDVPINLLLPGPTVQIAYTTGGVASRYSGIFTNQITGRDFLLPVEEYSFVADRSIDSFWSGVYGSSLVTFDIILDKAQENDALDYSAIAKISTAYTLGLATSFWGDIPYSQALNGLKEGELNPTYDPQEDIYSEIFRLLEEAINEIDADAPVTAPTPGADDLVYGGDMSKWRALANSLRARFSMHLLNRNGEAATYQAVLDAINDGAITSEADDFQWNFGQTEDFNPVFEFGQSRAGSMFIDNYFVGRLTSLQDPRRDFFYVSDAFGVRSNPGRYISSRNSIVNMMSYAETKFLEAEALLFSQGVAAAEPAFFEGVRAAVEKIVRVPIPPDERPGVDSVSQADVNTYLSNEGTLTGLTTEQAHEKIITQKYIALFLNPEVWNDYRRTQLPNMSPNEGNSIPTRLYYPNSEFLNNPNFPSNNPGLFERLWKDQ